MQQSVIKISTMLREITCHMGSQSYLPPSSCDYNTFTRAKLELDLVTLEGCKTELTWVVVISQQQLKQNQKSKHYEYIT